ncbi:MAG: PKD domain-containing protein [Verrucomicrobiia bacterium]
MSRNAYQRHGARRRSVPMSFFHPPFIAKILTRCARRTRCLIAASAAAVLLAHPTQASETQILRGHAPDAITKLNLQPVDRLPSTNRLYLAIGLPLRNRESLDNLIHQIYDPASPNYHHYLTPEQFTEMFGPTPRDYQAVIDFARSHGFTIAATHPNRVLLDVNASVADVERAFHVTMRVYRHPTEARTFYAPDTEPSIDLAVPILDISGLDNYIIPHPMSLKPTPLTQRANATPAAGSGLGGTYMGSDFRAAYVPGVSLTGTGQIVGLVEFDGYYASDITSYETQARLPGVTLTNVLLDGFRGKPGSADDEVSLDIEMAISMAPGLSKVIVYEAGSRGIPNDILNRMVTDNLAQQLSCSWTWGGGVNATTDQLFQEMAAQGQSFFQSSGDSGAYSGSISSASYPADDPYITVVGGTTLTTTGPRGSWVSETVWNWMPSEPDASSGGISTSYTIPIWQLGTSMSANNGSTTMRNIPDVALTADNIYVVYNNGQSGGFGGTSCAAPLWAAFTALVNQQAAANGHATVGFINPAIYSIGNSSSYTSNFHDVTTGNNTNSASPTKFFAAPGYDLCTGWGTPKGQSLIEALTGLSADLALTESASPNPATASLPLTYTLTITNNGPATAIGVTVTDALPASVTFNSVSASQGTCTSIAGVVTCNLGALTNSGVATVTISVLSNVPGQLTNTAVVTALIPDAVPSNNTFSVITTISNPPPFVVYPGSLDYGTLLTGQTSNEAFSVINNTPGILTGTVALATAGSPFAVVSESPFIVSAGQTGPVTVAFSPTSAGSYTNSVVFTSGSVVWSNAVTGAAITPAQLSVSPITLNFGTATVGNTVSASFLVNNNGGAVLSGTATITAAGFTIGSGASYNVPGFGSTNVVINFTPSSAKSFAGTTFFASNGGDSSNAVTGSGTTGPAARFTATPTNGSSPLVVTFSDTSTGTITNRSWNLGDGTITNTTATSLVHTYRCGGPYSVSLTVRGTGGSNTLTESSLITVVDTTPPTILACAPAVTVQADGVGRATVPNFTAGVRATDNCTAANALLKTQSPPAGTVVGPGPTTVTITVTDASGNSSTCTTTFTVQAPPPYAQFIGSPATGIAPLVVTFANNSTGLITSVVWNFGDGATSTATNPTHTYTNAATFSVSLTAQGPAGTNTLNRPGYITVLLAWAPIINSPPTVTNALLQVGNHAVVVADETNIFTVAATDPQSLPLGYQWQFGDDSTNATAPLASALHAYGTNCGPYVASVTVSNGYASVTTNLAVAVACEMPVVKLQLKPNFAKPNSDGATLTATPDLGEGFKPLGQTLVLNMGNAQVQFTLNKNGFGVSAPSTARLSLNKHTRRWTLKVRLRQGDWHADWASYGLVDATIQNPGTAVTVPVVVLVGDLGFAADRSLNYTATTHQAGLAK